MEPAAATIALEVPQRGRPYDVLDDDRMIEHNGSTSSAHSDTPAAAPRDDHAYLPRSGSKSAAMDPTGVKDNADVHDAGGGPAGSPHPLRGGRDDDVAVHAAPRTPLWYRHGSLAVVFACITGLLYLLSMVGGGCPSGDATDRGAAADAPAYLPATITRAACTHPVYCRGAVLRAVQLAGVFNDSKTFVDMPIRTSVDAVLRGFAEVKNTSDAGELREFLRAHFDPAGSDVHAHEPEDWHPAPGVLRDIADPRYRAFARYLHHVWFDLVRVFNHTDYCDACYSSLRALKHPFVAPGGRFREFYYWDTYWILEGLYVSEMFTTARRVLRNFMELLEEHGFVPNGARVYYLNRSQPPLFAMMVERYVQATGDTTILDEAVPAVLKEHAWWMGSGCAVDVPPHHLGVLNTYRVPNVTYPRPEAYREDVATVASIPHATTRRRDAVWGDIAGAAESGWDFSSRWTAGEGLEHITTSQIIPVDLNAILYRTEVLLAGWTAAPGGPPRGADASPQKFAARAAARLAAMQALLWDRAAQQWRDFNLSTNARVDAGRVYASDFAPLWVGVMPPAPVATGSTSADPSTTAAAVEGTPTADPPAGAGSADGIVAALAALLLPGGLPTSLTRTGQQWDFPNAWPNLQHIAVSGLRAVDTSASRALAERIVHRWLASNYCGWRLSGGAASGVMFEKYNATHPGLPGAGGEYNVQEGFGWTNGVALWMLRHYPTAVAPTDCAALSTPHTPPPPPAGGG